MAQKNLLLGDVTWEGSTFDTTIDLCDNITNCLGNDILMHLTCTSLTRERVVESLDSVKKIKSKIFKLSEKIFLLVLKGCLLKTDFPLLLNLKHSLKKSFAITFAW